MRPADDGVAGGVDGIGAAGRGDRAAGLQVSELPVTVAVVPPSTVMPPGDVRQSAPGAVKPVTVTVEAPVLCTVAVPVVVATLRFCTSVLRHTAPVAVTASVGLTTLQVPLPRTELPDCSEVVPAVFFTELALSVMVPGVHSVTPLPP